MGRGALWIENQQSTFAHIHTSSSHATTSPWSPIPFPHCVSTADIHLRVGGQIDTGSDTRNGVSQVRLAVGIVAVHRPRCGINHAGTFVYTLTASVRSRETNCSRRRPSTPAPQGESPASQAVVTLARVAGPRHPRSKANRPRRRPLPRLPGPQGESPAPPGEPPQPPAVAALSRATGRPRPRRKENRPRRRPLSPPRKANRLRRRPLSPRCKAKTARAVRQITCATGLAVLSAAFATVPAAARRRQARRPHRRPCRPCRPRRPRRRPFRPRRPYRSCALPPLRFVALVALASCRPCRPCAAAAAGHVAPGRPAPPSSHPLPPTLTGSLTSRLATSR